ncbi:MAG: glycosyltransferase family 9 protein [Acetobacteraceae bacterium]|nr:glycosyltransferase family 9 protein [Acetobacteraceae bacterium]
MPEPPRILVIKLSAFGNIVLSVRPFAAIRAHHPEAEISILTTPPYADWFAAMPYFDRVLVDHRPKWWDLAGLWRLWRMLRTGGFERIYDLQTSGRSSRYLRMFPRGKRPEWSGIAPGCSHPDRAPDRDRLHDLDRQISQLRQAGITEIPPLDLSWCHGDTTRFSLPGDLVLLVPGSSAHRPGKRWPPAHYNALAETLRARGMTPVVLGSAGEQALARQIPAGFDLTGQTTPGDIADLARSARVAIGNDTGPMHLIAAAGCPSVVLFSDHSDPALCAPRGPSVTVLHRPDLVRLDVAAVLDALPAAAPVTA